MSTKAIRKSIFSSALHGAVLAYTMFVAVELHAAPRGTAGPPEPQTPETMEAQRQQMALDMAAWLPRLVGRFDIQGVVKFNQTEPDIFPQDRELAAEGKADCIAVGEGAGVQCVLNVTWQEIWGTMGEAVEGGVPFLGPAAILFGFDPNASVIRYLLLNTNGIAEAQTGRLYGNTLRFYFETHCESNVTRPTDDNPENRCRRVLGIYAPPAAKYLTLTVDIEPWSNGRGTWSAGPMTSLSFDMRHPRSTEPPVP